MPNKYAFIYILILLQPGHLLAELYSCEGTWTNKPCDAAPDKMIESTSLSPTRTAPVLPLDSPEEKHDSQCLDGEVFIESRPEPLIIAEEKLIKQGKYRKDIKVRITSFGYGNIQAAVISSGSKGGAFREVSHGARGIRLSDKGQETEFAVTMSISNDWKWRAHVTNSGRFKGFCTTLEEQASMMATTRKYTNRINVEVNETNVVSNVINITK